MSSFSLWSNNKHVVNVPDSLRVNCSSWQTSSLPSSPTIAQGHLLDGESDSEPLLTPSVRLPRGFFYTRVEGRGTCPMSDNHQGATHALFSPTTIRSPNLAVRTIIRSTRTQRRLSMSTNRLVSFYVTSLKNPLGDV